MQKQEKKLTPKKPAVVPEELERKFQLFWSCYPRQAAETRARKAFEKAFHLFQDEETFQALLNHCQKAYIGTEHKYIPLACNYLKDERWKDPISPKSQQRDFMSEHLDRSWTEGL